jgi:hypothetical protein
MVASRVVPAFAIAPMAAHVSPCTTTAKVAVAPAAPSKLYIHEAATPAASTTVARRCTDTTGSRRRQPAPPPRIARWCTWKAVRQVPRMLREWSELRHRRSVGAAFA